LELMGGGRSAASLDEAPTPVPGEAQPSQARAYLANASLPSGTSHRRFRDFCAAIPLMIGQIANCKPTAGYSRDDLCHTAAD
jgi:hypothetical protein